MLRLQENDQRHARTVLNPAAGRPLHEHLAAVSLSATDTPLNPFSLEDGRRRRNAILALECLSSHSSSLVWAGRNYLKMNKG